MSKDIKPFKLEIGDKFVTRKDDEEMADFCKGAILTVSKIEMDSETIIYYVLETYEGEYGSWDNDGIDWEATSKLNKLSKLSATITVINPLVQIKTAIDNHPFKYEHFSEGSFCISLFESEIPICYYKGQLHLDVEICSVNITSDMMEEILKVMKIIEENLEFFLLKEEVLK